MKPKESPPKQGTRPEVVVAVVTAISAILVAAITVLPTLLDRLKPTPTPDAAAVVVTASPPTVQVEALLASTSKPAPPTVAPRTQAPTVAPQAAPPTATHAGVATAAAAPEPTTVAAPAPRITAANAAHLVEARTLQPFGSPVAVAFSPDGKQLVVDTTFNGEVYDFASHGERAFGKALYTFGDSTVGPGDGLALTRDGRLAALATSGRENIVMIYNLADGGFALHELRGHTAEVTGLAFSPDGAILATSSKDNSIRLWDVATGSQIKRQVAGDRGLMSVGFSPDGSTLVSGGGDGQVRVWDKAGQPVTATPYGELDIPDLDFNPAGTVLAAAAEYDAGIPLFDTSTWKVVKVLRGHERSNGGYGVFCVAFSPDGSLLASGGGDHTVRIWDVSPTSPTYGQSLVTLEGHSDWPNSMLFTPDGSALISGSERDGTIRVWEVAD